MSVRMAVYLVDWDAFQAKVHLDEDWEEFDEVEPVAFANESSKAPFAFMDAFDRFKRKWQSDEKLYFKEVFDALFWECRGDAYRIMELQAGEDGDLFGVDTALKPETVLELLHSAGKIRLEDCRPLFDATFDSTGRFDSFDKWRAYGEEWLELLGKAAEEGKGLIVAMFG